ncbi:Pregnancy-associated plasma protein-A [Amycolatopsis xylanica]|uniref:Pregnancy-associated plasma protein-A n=1 Tax=Amycolatopsis xylanica TaxID=589385 RepID=A0A1H3SE72_9PSEU|nr:zinc metalloprotease [Amycolatopsis xylanica]SDZ35970.1 Pregnancy-associated plasma protein-A [Amycolatopsis xylanica]
MLKVLTVSGLLAACLMAPAGASATVAATCVVPSASAFGDGLGEDADSPGPGVAAAVERDLQARVRANPAPRLFGAFTVPVVWNVFYDQENPADGNIPDAAIQQTMNVVNSYFNQAGLSFRVANVVRRGAPHSVVHGAAIDNAVERQLKQYRQGTVQTLNIYTVAHNYNNDLAGWATFPWDYASNPQNDGIVYDYNYLPGGKHVGYNTGKIMAHEIGHWVGLLHTFQDGCHGGDFVDDTPAEATPAHGCPVGRDTCAAPGIDPIDNMMDYSSDNCRVRLTSGQYNRFAQVLYQYRGINLY